MDPPNMRAVFILSVNFRHLASDPVKEHTVLRRFQKMQIKVIIRVDPLENWQSYRLHTIVEKLRKDLEGIQYQQDEGPSIEIVEVKPDAQIDAEREDTGFDPTMGDTEVLRG
jgi:hypothetical protein